MPNMLKLSEPLSGSLQLTGSGNFSGGLTLGNTLTLGFGGSAGLLSWSSLSPLLRAATGGTVNIQPDANSSNFIFSSSAFIMPATNKLHLDGGGDTYIRETSANHIDLIAGNVAALFANTNGAGIPATYKFYLDGGGDTYIWESSANQLDLYASGALGLRLTGGTVYSALQFSVPAAAKLFLDGGGDTYFIEYSANNLRTVVGNTVTSEFFTTQSAFYQQVSLESGKRLFLDGGGDTYIYEQSANRIDVVVGGLTNWIMSGGLNRSNVHFSVGATDKIYLDGGGNTYIYESAADDLHLVAGGVAGLRMNTTDVRIVTLNLAVDSTKKLYLDGGSDTYITESPANEIRFYAANTASLGVWGGGIYVPPTKGVYLDNGSDTYLFESASNAIGFVAGGIQRLTVRGASDGVQVSVAGSLSVSSGNTLSFDGGGDTYILESAANVLSTFVGGTHVMDMTAAWINPRSDVILQATKKLYLDGGTNTYFIEHADDNASWVTGTNVAINVNNNTQRVTVPFALAVTGSIVPARQTADAAGTYGINPGVSVPLTVANGSTITLGNGSWAGFVFLGNGNNAGQPAIFCVSSFSQTVGTPLTADANVYSTTKDTASRVNVYVDTGTSFVKLQNNSGVSLQFLITLWKVA